MCATSVGGSTSRGTAAEHRPRPGQVALAEVDHRLKLGSPEVARSEREGPLGWPRAPRDSAGARAGCGRGDVRVRPRGIEA